MGGQINIGFSASTFQNLPYDNTKGNLGENFTTLGVNTSCDKVKGLTIYTGLGITAPDKTNPEHIDEKTSYSFIGDIKTSHKYYDGENCSISVDSRSRFNINGESQTLALRLAPASVNVPLGNNVSYYATPYVLEKVDFSKGVSRQSLKDNFRAGIFTGVKGTVDIGGVPVTGFLEVQDYNLVQNVSAALGNQPMDWSTVGFNAGVSFSLSSIKW